MKLDFEWCQYIEDFGFVEPEHAVSSYLEYKQDRPAKALYESHRPTYRANVAKLLPRLRRSVDRMGDRHARAWCLDALDQIGAYRLVARDVVDHEARQNEWQEQTYERGDDYRPLDYAQLPVIAQDGYWQVLVDDFYGEMMNAGEYPALNMAIRSVADWRFARVTLARIKAGRWLWVRFDEMATRVAIDTRGAD